MFDTQTARMVMLAATIGLIAFVSFQFGKLNGSHQGGDPSKQGNLRTARHPKQGGLTIKAISEQEDTILTNPNVDNTTAQQSVKALVVDEVLRSGVTWKQQQNFRKNYFRDENHKEVPLIWFGWEPSLSCPSEKRIGDPHADGPKWVCNHRQLSPGCVVYSFGSSGETSFEKAILDETPCEVHTFDPTLDDTKMKRLNTNIGDYKKFHFHDYGISDTDGVVQIPKWKGEMKAVKTLKTIMKELKHTRIDVLKVDVETFEYAMFENMDNDGFPSIGQIQVEVHAYGRKSVFESIENLFNTMEKHRFRVFHKEPNLMSLSCCEYSWVNTKEVLEWHWP